MTLDVSVVVPTCRRPDLLARCLQALLEQDLEPWRYEVLVADDAADAAARQVVERIAARAKERGGPAVRYLAVQGTHGPAAARNAGWRAARAAVIAFTDDDCIPAPTWLRAGLAAFREPLVGVSGRLVVPLPAAPTDYQRDAAGLERSLFATANCFYRRAALQAVGGFDERFTLAWREDSDLFFTLMERLNGHGPKARFTRARDAVVVHPVRPGWWGISLSQQRKSLFNALLYKKHPRLYRRYVQAVPPWHYYAAVLSALAGLAALLAGRRRSALAGALAWLLLTGGFCAGRLRGTTLAPGHVAEMAVTSALIPWLAVGWRLRGALKFRVLFV